MRSYPRSFVALGNTIQESWGIVGRAPGLTPMLESRENPSSGEMMAVARSATRDLANCADTGAMTLLGRVGRVTVSCLVEASGGLGRLDVETSIEDPFARRGCHLMLAHRAIPSALDTR